VQTRGNAQKIGVEGVQRMYRNVITVKRAQVSRLRGVQSVMRPRYESHNDS